jgi:transcriptional regulator with XRE-family HTH domain
MEQTPEKTERGVAPSLAVEGARIRSIRETKKLTQLYVANVVGVTTDTISRWENNRYPSIKKENAEKLASALEVELAEILRRETAGEETAEAAPPRAIRSARTLLFSGLAALGILFLVVFLFARQTIHAPAAVRWAPHFAAPGEVIPVQIKVTREKGDPLGFILKEKLPDGFQFVNASPPSSISDSGAGIKWLIPSGSASVTVSYTMQVPTLPLHKVAALRGEVVVRDDGSNRTEAVGGSNTVQIGPYHWADSNGDGRIDDDEIMPAYYLCEAMKGLGLDWKTIESIWSGKGYRWNPQNGYAVIQ